MRALIITPPLVGHLVPTLGLGAELTRRGHAVAWAGHPALLDAFLPQGAARYPVSALDPAGLDERSRGLRGAAAFQFLWEEVLIPLTHAMTPGVQSALAAFSPDLLLVDHQAFAGALAARRHGLPWITSASTSASLVDVFGALTQLRSWMEDHMRALEVGAGLPPSPGWMTSDRATLAWTTRALLGDADLPPGTALVGPALAPRRADTPFPWERLDPHRRRVLITLGTVSPEVGGRFFAAAAEACRALDVQAIIAGPPLDDPPPGAIVQPFLPQLDLLPRVDAVICHGGHNTTVEALAAGLPLVLAPIRDDQPVIADQVVRAGAGLRVKFGRVSAAGLAEALARALEDPALRAGAARIAESFQEAGGVVAAAAVVERVAREG